MEHQFTCAKLFYGNEAPELLRAFTFTGDKLTDAKLHEEHRDETSKCGNITLSLVHSLCIMMTLYLLHCHISVSNNLIRLVDFEMEKHKGPVSTFRTVTLNFYNSHITLMIFGLQQNGDVETANDTKGNHTALHGIRHDLGTSPRTPKIQARPRSRDTG